MRKRIGEFLRDQGLLSELQLKGILEHSQRTGMKFGQAGVDLGIITTEKLLEVFGPHYWVDFFHLDAEYFPTVTRALFEPEVLLHYGILPLGYKNESSFFRKKRLLNVGFLHPTEALIQEVEMKAIAQLGSSIQGIRAFLLLGEQFVEVLEKSYGIHENSIRARSDKTGLNETLSLFIED